MQFLLHWTGRGPPITQFVSLSLHGAKKPTSITFETNSGKNVIIKLIFMDSLPKL